MYHRLCIRSHFKNWCDKDEWDLSLHSSLAGEENTRRTHYKYSYRDRGNSQEMACAFWVSLKINIFLQGEEKAMDSGIYLRYSVWRVE